MTFPHIDPEFDIHELHRAEREAEEAERRKVFETCNATLEAVINCPVQPGAACLDCGNEECFKAFDAQWALWGMTREEGIEAFRRQQIYAKWALIAQKKRFERYMERYERRDRFSIKKGIAA